MRTSRLSAEAAVQSKDYDDFLAAEDSESDASFEQPSESEDEDESSDEDGSELDGGEEEEEESRVIDRILRERVLDSGLVEYRVGWHGDENDDSWESAATLEVSARTGIGVRGLAYGQGESRAQFRLRVRGRVRASLARK